MLNSSSLITSHERLIAVEKLGALTIDLRIHSPRSPYEPLSEDFVVMAARVVDKCRADLLNQVGEYHYNCPLDQKFFAAAGLESRSVREFIASGADDKEVSLWMVSQAKTPKDQFLRWCRRFRANPLLSLLVFEDWLHRRRSRSVR